MVNKELKLKRPQMICGKLLKKGETAEYYETRYPNYCYVSDVQDVQIGIKYIKLWDHIECRNGLPFLNTNKN